MPKPIPVPDELSKPFWDAINERRLVLQNCGKCSRLQYPPEETCRECGSVDQLDWSEVNGRGHILEYLVTYDSRIKLKQADQPYNLALITLDDDPNINFLSNLPGTPVDEVPVGAPVEIFYEEVAPGRLIHEWRVIG